MNMNKLTVSEVLKTLVVFLLFFNTPAFANEDAGVKGSESKFKYVWNETEQERVARLQWWTDARFGMFIHWGLYAIPAHGGNRKNSEWVKLFGQIPDEKYQRYFATFNPDLYRPEDWARAAKQAGIKYVVIVAKHHDGFCLWDSQFTDYKAPNTPYGKDLLRPMIDAFRAAGIRVGLYYSLMDWHHPNYPIDRNHPQGYYLFKEKDPEKKQAYLAQISEINKGRDMRLYAKYMRDQVRELLTQFGQIDLLFLDFSYPRGEGSKGRDEWESEKLLALVRQLQPKIIVNDRLDLKNVSGGWDFKTPEHRVPEEWVTYDGRRVPWETCNTFGNSWGYFRDEAGWKSTQEVLDILISCVSRGGNLLFNVGPTARGTLDTRSVERLGDIAEWMRLHQQSIYSCTEAPKDFKAPDGCKLTYNPQSKRIYVHVFNWPKEKRIQLDGFANKIYFARLLNDGSEITYTDNPTVLTLPTKAPSVAVPVIEILLR